MMSKDYVMQTQGPIVFVIRGYLSILWCMPS